MSGLLVLCHDVVGRQMAGPGIRSWELARALAAHLPVTLAAPRPIDLDPPAGLALASYGWGDAASLAPLLAAADAVLANSHLLAAHPELAGYGGRLLLDLYDPVALENLELRRARPAAEQAAAAAHDAELLRAALACGDGFLCATERQRDLYMGGLLAAGRVSPAATAADPLLRDLIDVVPFGVSDEAPRASGRSALRGALGDLDAASEIILWAGGLWDWMDPQTLVRAMPAVLAARPRARLVFLAGRHPGMAAEMATPAATRALAGELGLLGRGVHLYDEWVPYERRSDFLLEADVVVSLHREQLETAYAAVRSRVLDHFWAGRPSLLSAGDPAAALVAAHDAGEVVPIGDAAAVAGALTAMLADAELRAAQAARAAELGARMRWPLLVGPILRMLTTGSAEPARLRRGEGAPVDPIRPAATSSAPDARELAELLRATRDAAIRSQERGWQLDAPPAGGWVGRLRGRLGGWLFREIIAQQRDQNAAALRTIYTIAEQIDQQRAGIDTALARIAEQRAGIDAALAQVEGLPQLSGRVGHSELRLDNLEAGTRLHNERQVAELHQVGQQIRDFAAQLAGLEETTTQTLAHLGGVAAQPPAMEER